MLELGQSVFLGELCSLELVLNLRKSAFDFLQLTVQCLCQLDILYEGLLG